MKSIKYIEILIQTTILHIGDNTRINSFKCIVKGGVPSNPSTMSLAHHITTSNHTIDVKYRVHGYKIRIKEKESRENYLESFLFFGSSSLSILLLAQRVE